MKVIERKEFFEKAYKGCYYTIEGCGGDINVWKTEYAKMLKDEGIGNIEDSDWTEFNGNDMNAFYKLVGNVKYPNNFTFLAFPIINLNTGKLAMFKLSQGDRWFNDIVDNNKEQNKRQKKLLKQS